MKKIKIFIGSSIVDLAYERRDLVSFIAELNNKYVDQGIYIEPYICEEKSSEMGPGGSQEKHNAYIQNEADVMIFMFFETAGQYTLQELSIARETLKNQDRKTHVFIYFKTKNNEVADTAEIRAVVKMIADEYAHYYKKFAETDTIKLELLQHLADTLGQDVLTIQDGKLYMGREEVRDIDFSNVFGCQNNRELVSLKKELQELEKQLDMCYKEKNWTRLAELSNQCQEKQVRYYKLEKEIFEILCQLSKNLREGKVNTDCVKALRLMEEGKYWEALELLPVKVIAAKTEALVAKRQLQDELLKQEAEEILQDAEARLRALWFLCYDEDGNYMKGFSKEQALELDGEIEKTYDSAVDAAFIAGKSKFLFSYVDSLNSELFNPTKARQILLRMEENFHCFTDTNALTKYNIYDLLAFVTYPAEESKYFGEKASACYPEADTQT